MFAGRLTLGLALVFSLAACAQATRAPDSPALVGDEAPGGIVVANNGTKVNLESMYDGQRAIIVFYRGHW